MKSLYRTASIAAFLLAGSTGALAQTQVHGTRVIYPAGEREVTIAIDTVGKTPRLLQVWVDSGNDKSTADTAVAPFVLTPPMSRVEAGKGQSFRLMFTGGDIPKDRESVFWFNVLEVPPRPETTTDESVNYLQFAVRTRLKIFYRPKGLVGDPLSALDTLTWRLVRENGHVAVECTNPSAYNVSIANIQFKGLAPVKSATPPGGMCPARGSEKIAMPDQSTGSGILIFNAINDYGGFVERESPYTN